jgi:hypothetical protein
MTERLPSLSLLAAEVRAERELLFRHADAVDAKAGIILGFAGAVVALIAARLDGWLVPGAASATYAALQCLIIFGPDRYPVWELRPLRDDFLRSETGFTQLHVIDAQIVMIERQVQQLELNGRRLRRALLGLGVAIGLLVAGTLASTIGG